MLQALMAQEAAEQEKAKAKKVKKKGTTLHV